MSLPAPANPPCFTEPQGNINIAKPPEAPTAGREALLSSAAATGSLTPSTETGTIQGCAAATLRAELGLRCEMQSRPPELKILLWRACSCSALAGGSGSRRGAGRGSGEVISRPQQRPWLVPASPCTCGQVTGIQDPHSLGRCHVCHSCILQGFPEAVGMGRALPRVPWRKWAGRNHFYSCLLTGVGCFLHPSAVGGRCSC